MRNDAERDESIGRQLRDFREAQGMSRDRLAETMARRGFSSWTRKTVWNIEAGRRALKFAEGREIEAILGREFAESEPREVPMWKQLQRAENANGAGIQDDVPQIAEKWDTFTSRAETACKNLKEACLNMATGDEDTWEEWASLASNAKNHGDKCRLVLEELAGVGDEDLDRRFAEISLIADYETGQRIIAFLREYPAVVNLDSLVAQKVLHEGGSVEDAQEAVKRAVAAHDDAALMPASLYESPAWVTKQTRQEDQAAAPVDGDAAKDAAQ